MRVNDAGVFSFILVSAPGPGESYEVITVLAGGVVAYPDHESPGSVPVAPTPGNAKAAGPHAPERLWLRRLREDPVEFLLAGDRV
jgi:hypothetical protein